MIGGTPKLRSLVFLRLRGCQTELSRVGDVALSNLTWAKEQ